MGVALRVLVPVSGSYIIPEAAARRRELHLEELTEQSHCALSLAAALMGMWPGVSFGHDRRSSSVSSRTHFAHRSTR